MRIGCFPGSRCRSPGSTARNGAAPTATMHRHDRREPGLARMRARAGALRRAARGLLLEDKGADAGAPLPTCAAPRPARASDRCARRSPRGRHAAMAAAARQGRARARAGGRDKGTRDRRVHGRAAVSRPRCPSFVGDDLTDEFGFAAVARRAAGPSRWAPGRHARDFRLPDVAAVRQWLAAPVAPPRAADDHALTPATRSRVSDPRLRTAGARCCAA